MNSTRNLKLASLFLALSFLAVPAVSYGGVFVSVSIAPPVLPVYVQPPCPGPDYMWSPGYWGYGPNGYFWVPGTWVIAPTPGLLWTPGYWGWASGYYRWNAGYWGPHVGFYGGVNYGFGYGGVGFVGGGWVGGHFRYNTAVMNVNTTVVHNTYVDRTVVHETVVNRTSFNGPGGINARPTSGEMAAEREHHFEATSMQETHERSAGMDRNNFASVNHGRPATAAISRPVGEPNRGEQGRAETNHGGSNRPEPNNRPQENRQPQTNHAQAHQAPSHQGGGGEHHEEHR